MKRRKCDICNHNAASGSVGKIDDPSFVQWVCSYCYYYVLKMKPLSDLYLAEHNQCKSEALQLKPPTKEYK